MRDHPLADRAGDRPRQLNLLGGNADGATSEFAPLAAGIAPACERIAAGNGDERACSATLDNRDILRMK